MGSRSGETGTSWARKLGQGSGGDEGKPKIGSGTTEDETGTGWTRNLGTKSLGGATGMRNLGRRKTGTLIQNLGVTTGRGKRQGVRTTSCELSRSRHRMKQARCRSRVAKLQIAGSISNKIGTLSRLEWLLSLEAYIPALG